MQLHTYVYICIHMHIEAGPLSLPTLYPMCYVHFLIVPIIKSRTQTLSYPHYNFFHCFYFQQRYIATRIDLLANQVLASQEYFDLMALKTVAADLTKVTIIYTLFVDNQISLKKKSKRNNCTNLNDSCNHYLHYQNSTTTCNNKSYSLY